MSNKLKQIIKQEILDRGAMPIDRFMELALSHPEHGYYIKSKPIGKEGDFITAPEVSQLFGEILGLWVVEKCQKMIASSSKLKSINLIELGGGQGTMLQDICRVLELVPEVIDKLKISIVEINNSLIEIQKRKLEPYFSEITYHRYIDSVDFRNSIVLCNEFFDALPIKQHILTTEGWKERKIQINNDRLTFSHKNTNIDIKESSPVSEHIMTYISQQIEKSQGAALIIDYGYFAQKEEAKGDTLQALRKHKYNNVLENIGDCDITAHVNFKVLEDIANRYNLHTRKFSQAEFLFLYGIQVRAERLKADKDSETQKSIDLQLDRLCSPDQMGSLFKVLEVGNI